MNYHYVEDPRKDFGGIVPCPVAEFKRQIAFLSAHFSIVSVEDVVAAAHNESKERLCAITFDDGLLDQYENAAPILRRCQATATFFIITSAFERRLPVAHKLHVLLSLQEATALIATFNAFLSGQFPQVAARYRIPADRRLNEVRWRRDDMGTANLKHTMAIVPDHVRAAFFTFCFDKWSLDEKALVAELFMNADHVRQLSAQGFTIGNHSHEHRAFDALNHAALEADCRMARDTLHALSGIYPEIISYPHGRFTDAAIDMVENRGLARYGVTTESRSVTRGDIPWRIPRFDTNDIKQFMAVRA